MPIFHLYALHIPVILGAFCGSLFYGVTAKVPAGYKKGLLLVVAFVTGLVAAEFMANVLSGFTSGESAVGQPVGGSDRLCICCQMAADAAEAD
jgi:hypothetical protein